MLISEAPNESQMKCSNGLIDITPWESHIGMLKPCKQIPSYIEGIQNFKLILLDIKFYQFNVIIPYINHAYAEI